MFNSNHINFKKLIEVSQKQGIPILNLNAQIIMKFAYKKEIKKYLTQFKIYLRSRKIKILIAKMNQKYKKYKLISPK